MGFDAVQFDQLVRSHAAGKPVLHKIGKGILKVKILSLGVSDAMVCVLEVLKEDEGYLKKVGDRVVVRISNLSLL